MLRKIRIVLAALFFTGITLMFLDFTGVTHAWLDWMAKVQFLPAVLSLNLGVVALLLILTLLFGRVYCSVICPMGVMQDIISWIHGRTKKKNKYRFSYSPAKNWLRYTVLAVFILLLTFGAHSIAVLIAPYSAYGRIAGNLFAPVYKFGNNILAWIAERMGSYAFYSTEIWIKSGLVFAIAVLTFIIIGFIAWKYGRSWCNTICPAGTILGTLSKFSLFAPVIDTNKCRNCGLCGKQCKSSCIDMKNHKIDYSRCVVCMDCIDSCREGAIRYAFRYGKKSAEPTAKAAEPDKGRRAFMSSAILAISTASSLRALEMIVDGGLADIDYAKRPQREGRLVPAGALSVKNMSRRCTTCQLCISVCPNQVLRPSTSLLTLMQPEMSYDRGYCRPECTLCSEICPAGAIKPISREEKSSIQIGHAVVNLDLCIVNKDGNKCGNCARHCPVGAIKMVRKNPEDPKSLMIPTVNEERCIGCGACENLCPSRPYSAIYVEGHQVHKTI